MTTFRDENDLRRSIQAAGLEALAERMIRTARPAIRFERTQVLDDDLRSGASKHGGLPDLPVDFDWPHRPARPDAALWEQSIRRRRAQVDAILSRTPSTADGDEQIRRRARDAEVDARRDLHETLLIESFHDDFPLAFRAQFDLSALAAEPGFDADLPREGVLSIFEDMTGDGGGEDVHVFWHDRPAASLVRREAPQALVALSDTHVYAQPWATLDKADLLLPHNALSLPHHWLRATAPDADRRYALIRSPKHEFTIDADAQAGGDDFGDQLGGWPNPIQLDPEVEFLGEPGARLSPGDDRIRQIFQWAGEYHEGTRLPYSDTGGDGITHVLMPRDALLRRAFGEARGVYQSD